MKNHILFITLLMIILTSTASAYSISGYVKDTDGNRLPDALISGLDYSDFVHSDSTGHFIMGVNYPLGTYHFTVTKVGYNPGGIDVRIVGYDVTNADATLTLIPGVPSVTTLTATDITSNSATLRSSVNPNGFSTNVDFVSNDASGSSSYFNPIPLQNIGSGNAPITVTSSLTNLNPSTTYSYLSRATNPNGAKNGFVVTFTTLSLATPTPTSTPTTDNGILKIKSNVPAKAYVDNVFAGDTNPNDYLTYFTTATAHTILVSASGYISYSLVTNVKSDKNANPFTTLDINLIAQNPTLPSQTSIFPPPIPTSTPSNPFGGFSGFGLPDFKFPDFKFPCIFGCSDSSSSGWGFPNFGNWNPFSGIDFNCIFGCQPKQDAQPNVPNNPQPKVTVSQNNPPNAVTILNTTIINTTIINSAQPPNNNIWWLLLLIIVLISYYIYDTRGKKS